LVVVPGGTSDDGHDFDGFDLNDVSPTDASLDSALYLDLDLGTYFVAVASSELLTSGLYRLKVYSESDYDSGIPILSSNPGASDTLYLDFDGHTSSGDAWNEGAPYAVDGYDWNANIGEITPGERMAIRNVWRTVAEDFAPFAINVTTVEPGSFANGVGFRHVITNSSPTVLGLSSTILGIAFLDSYAGFMPEDNLAFTFASNYSYIGSVPGFSSEITAMPIEMGNTTSHEFGHALGLAHFDASQTNAIMSTPDDGLNRERWFHDTNVENNDQDDMAIISNSQNTIGYRADDHGNSSGSATALELRRDVYAASGVVEELDDKDFFQFVIPGGMTSFTVDLDQFVANFDAELLVYNASGIEVASSDPAGDNALGISMSVNLAPGTYFAEVRSDVGPGEAGQYNLIIRVQS
jgi:hypothetical protein